MTKAEELKLLEQIDALINSADEVDYIPMTFAGIVEVCRRNIEDDFGDSPVQDLEDARNLLHAEERRHDETKRMLAEAQKALKASEENTDYWKKCFEEAKSLADEWEGHAHAIAEDCDNLAQKQEVMEEEIRKLKAEIVRMRMERMTDKEYAELYECVKGVE